MFDKDKIMITKNESRIKSRSDGISSHYHFEYCCNYFDEELWKSANNWLRELKENRKYTSADLSEALFFILLFTDTNQLDRRIRIHDWDFENTSTKYVKNNIECFRGNISGPECINFIVNQSFNLAIDYSLKVEFDKFGSMNFTTQEYFTKLILSFCNEENKAKFAALIINTSMFKSLVNYQQGGKYIQLGSNGNYTINGHSGVQYHIEQNEHKFFRCTLL